MMLEGRELITYHSQRKVTGCYTNIVTEENTRMLYFLTSRGEVPWAE